MVRCSPSIDSCNSYRQILDDFGGSPCDTSFRTYFNARLGTSHTQQQILALFAACGDTGLCGATLCVDCPLNEPVVLDFDPCTDSTDIAITTATELYRIYRHSVVAAFDEAYMQRCLSVDTLESFTISQRVNEYHYTLYYYDQAGNLVKTVPPSGVQPNRNPLWLKAMAQKRMLRQ